MHFSWFRWLTAFDFLSITQSSIDGDSRTSASHLDQSVNEDTSKVKIDYDAVSKEMKVDYDVESKEMKDDKEENIVSI